MPVLELALVDQAGLKLRDLPVFASPVLGLKASATTVWSVSNSFTNIWDGIPHTVLPCQAIIHREVLSIIATLYAMFY